MTDKLASKLDSVRNIPGFPKAEDSDIISLSDPPHYTACPNPFLGDFIKENSTPYDPKKDQYHREPFTSDLFGGKNHPVYNAHAYHTKVPHQIIMRCILHYTQPGDVVYDGFCGTGMTGVASFLCGFPELELKKQIEEKYNYVKWGIRKSVLTELSPFATFIASNFNSPVGDNFEDDANSILDEVKQEYSWMHQTQHTIDGKIQYESDVEGTKKSVKGRINFTIWSDVFICPNCTNELVFWDVAVKNKDVQENFSCTNCKSNLTKRGLERSLITIHDSVIGKVVKQAKQIPVLINYTVVKAKKSTRYYKKPDRFDLDLIKKIDEMKSDDWYPTSKLPEGYNTNQPIKSHKFTKVTKLSILCFFDLNFPTIFNERLTLA